MFRRLVATTWLGAVLAGVLTVAAGGALPRSAEADSVLVFETKDWRFEAPEALGTQADLELAGRQVQLCTDEIERLIHHRPTNVPRFTWRWSIGGGPGSVASPVGVETSFPNASYRLVDPTGRAFEEGLVARSVCFGPHEVSHVLTWESWPPQLLWANEGFATFMEWLYAGGSWRYGDPVQLLPLHDCDENGYTDGPTRNPYANLRLFQHTTEMYSTAACFWLEVYRRGGFPALRRILMRLRATKTTTAGELVRHNVDPVLGLDFGPIAERYGFTAADLVAQGPPPTDPPPPALVLTRPKPAATARSGRTFSTDVAVVRSDTGDPPSLASVSCAARIDRMVLRASKRSYASGRASCSWRLPRTARGRTLHMTIAATERAVTARSNFSARIR